MSTVDGKTEIQVEASLTEALHDAPVPIVSGYLFGSHAEGRAHAESDIDVGVLLPRGETTERGRFEARILLTSWLIGRLHRNDIDVVILNDAPPTLGRRIVTQGRRVACLDADADHAFVRDVQLRAADLEPFLRRMRAVKLESTIR